MEQIMNEQAPQKHPNFIEEIGVQEILDQLREKKLFIGIFTSVFAIFAVLYSLSLPNLYISNSLLMPVNSSSGGGSSSMSKSVSGLASAVGLSIGAGGETDKGTLAIETIKSRDFFQHLLTFKDVFPVLVALDYYDDSTQNILFDENLYDSKLQKWKNDNATGITLKPNYLEAYDKYREILRIDRDKFSNIIQVSIKHESPKFAYEFLTLIIDQLNEISRARDLLESKESLEYLYSQIPQVQQADIQLSIYQLIESQLRTQMLANVKKNYLLQPLDKPFIPDRKSEPYRARLCVLITLFGLFLSTMFVLVRHFGFHDLKND